MNHTSLTIMTCMIPVVFVACDGELNRSTLAPPSQVQDRYISDEPQTPATKEETPLEPHQEFPAEDECEATTPVTTRPLRRLSKDEYINTLYNVFPKQSVDHVKLRLDGLTSESVVLAVSPGAFDPYLARQGDRQKLELRLDISRLLAEYLTQHPELFEGTPHACLNPLEQTTATCVESYLQDTISKLIARDLTEEERRRFMTTWHDDAPEIDTNATRLELILTEILYDPETLFQIPQTSPTSNPAIAQLSQFTIAQRLSFASWGAPPDQELLQAARENLLSSAETREQHAKRLLDTPQGRTHIKQLFSHWLALERSVDLEPAGKQADVDINNLYDEMKAETLTFVDHIIFEQRGSYTDLLTSPLDFPQSTRLANLMGHQNTAPTSGMPSTTGRAGLMSRPALMVHQNPRSALIHRGVHIMYRFLCSDLSLPTEPINEVADAAVEELGDQIYVMTSREIAEAQTDTVFCTGCHSYINPLGFVLGSFGPLGNSWEQEHVYDSEGQVLSTLDLNTTVDLRIDGSVQQVENASEFATFIAASDEGRSCATTQIFRITHKRDPVQEDACHLKQIRSRIDQDAPLFDILVYNAAHESILIPTPQEP